MDIKKYLRGTSPKSFAVIAGLAFYLWVFVLFIQTINASNREIEHLDNILFAASDTLFRIASDSALPSDSDHLGTVLEEIRSNRALQNLVTTMADEKLSAAIQSLADHTSLSGLNGNINYIGSRIRVYKSAQYESMSELFFLFTLLVVLSIVISVMAYRENKKKLAEKDIQTELNKKLNAMLEAERNTISLELHDDLAQKLSVIKQHFYAPETGTEHSEILKRYIGDSIVTVRQIANRLRSPVFERYSLQEQLLLLFSDFSGSSPVLLTHQVIGLTSLDLDETSKLHLYRIIQELLSNCRKHSCAAGAVLKILYSHPVLSIQYSDDGIGYDPDTVERGLGLDGISFRLALIGGTLRNDSSLQNGTHIKIEVPV